MKTSIAVAALLVMACAALAGEPLSRRLTDRLVAAGVRVTGVSPESEADKSTWRIDFAPDATKDDQAAAKAIVDAWDVDAEGSAMGRADARTALYKARAEAMAIEQEFAADPDNADMKSDLSAKLVEIDALREKLKAMK